MILLKMLRAIFIEDAELFKEILEDVLRLIETLGTQSQEKTGYYHTSLIVYVISVRHNITIEEIVELAEKIHQGRGEAVMTIAEKLKKEGKKEGFELSLIAMKAFKEGKSINTVMKMTGMDKASLKVIKNQLKN